MDIEQYKLKSLWYAQFSHDDDTLEYHSFNNHILPMLQQFSFMYEPLLTESEVRDIWTAILFHDIVYVPGRSDNEKKSASLLRHQTPLWITENCNTAIVEWMIYKGSMPTFNKLHDPDGFKKLDDILHDLDYAYFAHSWTLDIASRLIIREYFYHDFDAVACYNGRIEFLKGLISKKIFRTKQMARYNYNTDKNIVENIAVIEQIEACFGCDIGRLA